MHRLITLLLAAGVLGSLPPLSLASGGSDEVLYVDAEGFDMGLCDNALRPCRTIGYALQRLGKGGEIRVGAGRYEVDSPEDLFAMVSGLARVEGGYDATGGFLRKAGQVSTLVGAPANSREILRDQGFHVIADRKSSGAGEMLAAHIALEASLPATACTGGSAAGLPCANVDLLSHVGSGGISARPGDAADVWGFVDLNTNREYALIGFDIGTAVFDVTDATNPREVGFVPGQATVWRDIKVHQFWNAADDRWNAIAYITTDGVADGLFVVDLSGLPHSVERLPFPTAGEFAEAHNIYAANTDFGTGLSLTGTAPVIVIAGSDRGAGQFRPYSTLTPATPDFIGPQNDGGYMHDAASLFVSDSRRSQCPSGGLVCEVMFDFNETTIDLWDITNPASPAVLSRTPSPIANSRGTYIHSGWPSEDGQYLFVHDEFDEYRGERGATTLRVYSLASLAAPTLVTEWSGPTPAIDHNGFVRGNRYYMSNYMRGLTILDITDPSAPVEAGFLDTYPALDSANFAGAWGTYPFFHSGNIAISDIDTGFYMAADRTLDVPAGRLGFGATSFGGPEGTTLAIPVSRSGGTLGAVSVAYEVIPATGDSLDIVGGTGTLSWGPGDLTDKPIDITLASDGNAEALERLLVKLKAPTGGATLDTPNVASLYVGEPGVEASIEFAETSVRIAERGFATAVAVFERSGSATGAVSVDYSLASASADAGVDFFGPVNGTISWPAGDADPRWIEFSITNDGSGEPTEFFELVLSNASGALVGAADTLRIQIADGAGINVRPTASAGDSQTVAAGARVSLDGSASSDPEGDPLSFAWTQTSGPGVTLSNASSANASFSAPSPASNSVLGFSLTVTDSGGLAATATTTVTVQAARTTSPNQGGGGGGPLDPLLLLGLVVASLRLARRRG